ncbi:putative lipid II flippase FtsW [Candidatus Berkelbacteria bacterium]|nr:putative lipid II flippase FtsW [Candidatus Berkelbacteria bacterium]
MSLNRYRKNSRARIDTWLLLAVLALVGFGLIMISSSSVVLSSQLFDQNYYFVTQQAVRLLVGLFLLVALAVFDYHLWQKYILGILVLIGILLILPMVPGIAATVNGAQRWIALGPVQLQPSEFVKVLAIIYFAAWFSSKKEHITSLAQGFLPFITILGLIGGLILIQPDAGTTMVLVLTVVVMYFIAGAPLLHLFFGGVIGGSLLGLLIISAPYRLQRLLVFLNPEEETLGAAYHINQALLAVGAGGLFGLGFGNSKQKFLYLPEPHTDSIFAITIEELGFIRSLFILAVLAFVVFRGFKIARYAPDDFGRLLAVGLTTLIAIQIVINIGAMLGLMPLTGVTLPFISFGGSSLISLLGAVGILLSISRYSQVKYSK